MVIVPLEKDFLDLMVDSITVATVASLNAFGVPAFSGSSHTFKARAEHGAKAVRNQAGEQVVASLILYIPTVDNSNVRYVVQPTDEITLADGSHPLVVACYFVRDEHGDHHQQIYATHPRA